MINKNTPEFFRSLILYTERNNLITFWTRNFKNAASTEKLFKTKNAIFILLFQLEFATTPFATNHFPKP